MQQAKILIVDDDRQIRTLLERYLSQQGFVVSAVGDGQEMTRKLERDPIDLIVLDWMMPGEDGLSICQRLSADKNNPPIIMLTANGSADSRISGLEGGADDYLPKPFEPRELVARIHAVLRRRPRVAAAIPIANSSSLYFGPYRLDSAQRCLYREDAQIALTGNEFALLNVLAQHAGTPLSRDRIAYLINGRNHGYDDRSLDVQVSRLRRLVEDDPARPRYLQTVRGLGYVLIQQEEKI
ncbi:MAG: response regulator [Methylococcales bacterium]